MKGEGMRSFRWIPAIALAAVLVGAFAGAAPAAADAPGSTRTNWVGSDVRVNSDANTAGIQEPAIAINPKNPSNILLAAMDRSYLQEHNGFIAQRLFRSINGGKTWIDGGYVPMPGNGDGWFSGDPSIAFDSEGIAYMTNLAFRAGDAAVGGLVISRSQDRGRTWTSPQIVVPRTYDEATDTCYLPDKELITVDRRTGRIYLTYSYVTVARCKGSGLPLISQYEPALANYDYEIMLQTSDDKGRTWSKPNSIYSGMALGATPQIGPDGTLFVSFWANEPYPDGLSGCPSYTGIVVRKQPVASIITVAVSKDEGKTWTYHKERSCPLVHGPQVTGWGGGLVIPAMALDASDNVVYVAWPTLSPDGTPTAINVVSSDDSGSSWSPVTRATPVVSGDAWMPAIAATSGTARLAYIGQKQDDGTYEVLVIESSDKGLTWSEPIRISTEISQRPTNGGDYMQMSIERGRIAVAWPDTRDNPASDIFVRTGTVLPSNNKT